VIDLHAHVLPGLDDGPADLETSVRMATTALEAGTRTIAATSHINRGFGLTSARLREAREEVNGRLAELGIPVEVIQGGEIALSRAGDLDDEELGGLTLGGSRWLLLECPLSPLAPSMEPMVARLRDAGYEILLAHPERSPTILRSRGALDRMVSAGALGQVTSGSLSGRFGDRVREAAFAMIERGQVHVIASDGHHPTQRPPELTSALAPLRNRVEDADALFEWMVAGVPAALLGNERPPARPRDGFRS
jgi:protein-tyrosine phosphatase